MLPEFWVCFKASVLVNPIVAAAAQERQKVVIIDGFGGSYVFLNPIWEHMAEKETGKLMN